MYQQFTRLLGALCLTLLTVLGLLVLFLQTPQGRAFAIHRLSATLEKETGYQLTVKHSESHFPFYLAFSGIQLKKRSLPTHEIEIDKLQLWWSATQLLSGRLAIQHLTVSGISYSPDAPLLSLEAKGRVSLYDPLDYALSDLSLVTDKYYFQGAFEGKGAQGSQQGLFAVSSLERPHVPLAVGRINWTDREGLRLQTHIETLRWEEVSFRNLQLQVEGFPKPEGLYGELRARAHVDEEELSLTTPFSYSSTKGLKLKEINGHIDGKQQFSGALTLFHPVEGITGALKAKWDSSRGPSEAKMKLSFSPDQGHSVHLNVEGPDYLTVDAHYLPGTDAYQLTLETLNGEFRGNEIALDEAVHWQSSEKTQTLSPLSLRLGEGSIQGHFSSQEDEVKGALHTQGLPLGFIELLYPSQAIGGKVTGEVLLSGTTDQPHIELSMELKDCRQLGKHQIHLPQLSGRLKAQLHEGRMQLNTALHDEGQETVATELSLPFKLSLRPLQWELPADEDLSGKLHANGALLPLVHVFLPDATRLTGDAELDVSLGGTLADPLITGEAEIRHGVYESLHLGTPFRDIEASLHLNGRTITLTRLTATDGTKGVIEGEGVVEIDSEQHFPYRVDARIQKSLLFQEDLATARASGALRLEGDRESALLSGKLRVAEATIHIPEKVRASVPTLDNVTYINGPGASASRSSGEDHYVLSLDLKVISSGHVFVQGRGLSSEWEGELQVGGTTKKPIIFGPLKALRGEFHFAGKEFRIQEGLISFQGDPVKDTTLGLQALLNVPDYAIYAELKGALKAPRLTLHADPVLDQAEILSRILFNKGIQHVNGIQALALTSAAMELSGHDTWNVLGKVRDGMGLDYIDIYQEDSVGTKSEDASSGRNLAIKIGKQISHSVFISVSRGVHTGNTRVGVEAQVGRGFSLEAGIGDDNGGEFSLQWKRDY